jgi:hypothetical protein
MTETAGARIRLAGSNQHPDGSRSAAELGPVSDDAGVAVCEKNALCSERGGDAVLGYFRHNSIVLGSINSVGFIDQHHGNTVAYVVAACEARVVKRILVFEVIQRTLVFGARQDLEQLGIQSHALSVGDIHRKERHDQPDTALIERKR